MEAYEPRAKFIEELKRQLEDEVKAYSKYQSLARVAGDLQYGTIAETLRSISLDESRHHTMLSQAIEQVSWAGPVGSLGRLFPKTYDDWADLGIDIRAKDPSIVDEVQTALTHIYAKTPEADEAKRWLVRMAGELGIT